MSTTDSAFPEPVSGPRPACAARIVGFDFSQKQELTLSAPEVAATLARGVFVWIDIDFSDVEAARALLAELSLLAPELVEDALSSVPGTLLARYEEQLHFVVSGCRIVGRSLELERVDAVLGVGFLLTIHRGPVLFLEAMQKHYRGDFVRFARTPSFLIYEIWDHLVSNYLRVQRGFEERVEALQTQLMSEVDDEGVFGRVSELGADLLHFRKVVLPARAVLADLATRRSLHVSEATQPYLVNMVSSLERVLQDLLVDRDILAGSLNLYMSMVGHRTNQVMKRLTVVSVIFLPLTFLCGVYGMNFEYLPELGWRFGYPAFWALAVLIVVGIVWFSRRARLL